MGMNGAFSARRVQADATIVDAGGVYHGGILVATSGGAASVSIYDGIDTSGELIDYIAAPASDHDIHVLEAGIRLKRGLYVDVGSNVSSFVAYFDPAVAGPGRGG